MRRKVKETMVPRETNIRTLAIMGSFLYLFLLPALSMELLSPESRMITYESHVSVIVDIADEQAEYVTITADGNQSYTLPVIANKATYCTKVSLTQGNNHIEAKSYAQEKVVSEKRLEVYYASSVDKAYKYPPKEYQQGFFHTQAKEAKCAACHDMAVNENPGVAFADITESNCYACHKELGENKCAHAPSVNWLCTNCHNGQTGVKNSHNAGRSKYLFPDPIGPVCLGCHNDSRIDRNRVEWVDKRYHHDPAESGRCNRCHNPHSSPNPVNLRKPTWELCVGCHADKAEGAHVVNTSFVRPKHPTRGVPDPSREGHDLSCTSCHNPHASNKPYFLPDNRGNQMICTMCHKK